MSGWEMVLRAAEDEPSDFLGSNPLRRLWRPDQPGPENGRLSRLREAYYSGANTHSQQKRGLRLIK